MITSGAARPPLGAASTNWHPRHPSPLERKHVERVLATGLAAESGEQSSSAPETTPSHEQHMQSDFREGDGRVSRAPQAPVRLPQITTPPRELQRTAGPTAPKHGRRDSPRSINGRRERC